MKDLNRCLNVMGVTHCSSVDGPGLRTVVWFQGCKNHCPGCHNPDSWDMDKKMNMYSPKELVELAAPNKLEDGLTLSGGDPFWQKNLVSLDLFIAGYRYCNPEKTIWLYTGLTWEELSVTIPIPHDPLRTTIRSILCNIDVLVEGRYIEALKSTECLYRGSTNQRLIDTQATLKTGELVLFDEKSIQV